MVWYNAALRRCGVAALRRCGVAALRPTLAPHRIPFPALALAVCLLFAAVGAAAVDDYGLSHDQPLQRFIAGVNAYYIAGDRDALTGRLSNLTDRSYGMAFELSLLTVEWALGLQETGEIYLSPNSRGIFRSRYMTTHLFFIAGGFFCGLLIWRMFGSRTLALLAMLLFLLHPRLYAHSFFNSKDIPFTVMFVIALYLMHRAFRRDTLGAFALLGLVVGIAANMRPFALLLLPAALLMLGLDWWQSHGGGRKRILLAGGVFIAAALLAIYVSHPYYWENPLRFIQGLQALSQHPNSGFNMFQGQIVPSDAVPPEYIPVWFAITAPPLALLLGCAGIAAVVWRALRHPRQALRRGELRFCLLLLGCFVIPVAVVIILQSNIYNGWRQMYFLWAPFCLLAAAGGRYIYTHIRGNLGRAAMYAAAMAIVGSAAYAIVSLHPYQHIYFNPLVDRETPERLKGQFEMSYWGVSHKEGLEYLLQRYPEGPLRVARTTNNLWNAMLLRDAERQRLILVDPEAADFHLADDGEINHNGAPPGVIIHAIKVYNNSILVIKAADPPAPAP